MTAVVFMEDAPDLERKVVVDSQPTSVRASTTYLQGRLHGDRRTTCCT